MSLQHSHSSTPFSQRKHPITLICDGVSGPANIGALFRLCYALGVQQLIFGNADPDLSSSRLRKTARGTEVVVPHETTPDVLQRLQQFKRDGHRLVALEITSQSVPLSEYTHESDVPTVLVIGNERTGISEEILALMDSTFHIEMYGHNSSMNVVQATAIALYQLIHT